MDVLVCGSRSDSNKTQVFDVLDSVAGRLGISRILYRSMGTADELACEWADRRNVPVCQADPYWASEGKSCAVSRAKRKRSSLDPDLVIAFPGEDQFVRHAKTIGLTVIEIDSYPAPSKAIQRPVATAMSAGRNHP